MKKLPTLNTITKNITSGAYTRADITVIRTMLEEEKQKLQKRQEELEQIENIIILIDAGIAMAADNIATITNETAALAEEVTAFEKDHKQMMS